MRQLSSFSLTVRLCLYWVWYPHQCPPPTFGGDVVSGLLHSRPNGHNWRLSLASTASNSGVWRQAVNRGTTVFAQAWGHEAGTWLPLGAFGQCPAVAPMPASEQSFVGGASSQAVLAAFGCRPDMRIDATGVGIGVGAIEISHAWDARASRFESSACVQWYIICFC